MKCVDRHWTYENKCAPKNRMQTLDGGTNCGCRRGLNGDQVAVSMIEIASTSVRDNSIKGQKIIYMIGVHIHKVNTGLGENQVNW